MGKVKPQAPTSLRISLYDPGLTPLLRAGLGGLAAAAHALAPDALGNSGTISIEAQAVVLDWGKAGKASALLEKLFAATFRIREGLFDFAGSQPPDPSLEVRVAMTDAMRLSFLQHGSTAKKAGAASARSFEIDDQARQILVQAYTSIVHQDAWQEIGKKLDTPGNVRSGISLAGWANPGAVERHVGLGCTDIDYTPSEALCACFALIGCLSLQGPNRTGVLIVVEPSDLVKFAECRPLLAPRKLSECFVASPGDGALLIHAALAAAEMRAVADGVANVSAMSLRATAWATQQKSRTDCLICARFDESALLAFRNLASCCPPRIVPTKGKKAGDPGSYWGIPSSLRGFVANNLARGHPWFKGFAFARTGDNPPCWLHRFHSSQDNLGGLRYPDDQKGLIAMNQTLDVAERRLIASIHTALRQRFGAIADETSGNLAAFKNRCQGERDKWRLAFSGARTHEQVRHALADLWSRAGTIRDLQGEGWQDVQPLLQPDSWEAARDLALIAMASYQGKGDEIVPISSTDTPIEEKP
jgi:CRISPR-associated protein Cas8a1/Csx13